MAWSAPAAAPFTIGQVVTAAQMNQISDNTRYLKGLAGNVTLEAGLLVTPAAGTALVRLTAPTTGDFATMELIGARTWQFATAGSAVGAPYTGFYIYDSTAAMIRHAIDPLGNMEQMIGLGGKALFLSANAVNNTLQTLAPAGTFAGGAAFYIIDRNNTGGANGGNAAGTILALGGTITYVNTDTVVVTLTAGGGVTVQRTVGTNGTHQVNMLVIGY